MEGRFCLWGVSVVAGETPVSVFDVFFGRTGNARVASAVVSCRKIADGLFVSIHDLVKLAGELVEDTLATRV